MEEDLLEPSCSNNIYVPANMIPQIHLVEHGQLRVAVHAEPVLGVVDGYQVGDELLVRLADVAPLALLRAKHGVVVQGIVHHGET